MTVRLCCCCVILLVNHRYTWVFTPLCVSLCFIFAILYLPGLCPCGSFARFFSDFHELTNSNQPIFSGLIVFYSYNIIPPWALPMRKLCSIFFSDFHELTCSNQPIVSGLIVFYSYDIIPPWALPVRKLCSIFFLIFMS